MKLNRKSGFFLPAILLLLGLTGRCWASNNNYFVFFDYTASKTSPKVYVLKGTSEQVNELPLGDKANFTDDQQTVYTKLISGQSLINFVSFEDKQRTTFIAQGDTLDVYAVYANQADATGVTLSLTEVVRDPKYVQELKEAFGKVFATAAGKPKHFYYVHANIQMTYIRSNVSLNVVNQTSKNTDTLSLITGPTESVFLTGELPFTNTSFGLFQISSGGVTNIQKPRSFDLGVNWLLAGDVYDPGLKPLIHLFGQFSQNPENEMGIGVGICLPNFENIVPGLKLDLSTIVVSENFVVTSLNGTSFNGQFATMIGCDLLSIPSWF